MPTYDYRCRDCNHEFEIQQSFSEDALTECPECKGDLRKVFGNVAIAFKGSGFYKTDSRGSAKSGASSSSSSSESTSSTTDSSSSTTSSDSSSTAAKPADSSSSSSSTSAA